MQSLDDLLHTIPQIGRLDWIGLAPARRSDIIPVESAEVQVGTGLEGDHHARRGGGRRQVTLIQAEHLPAVASMLQREAVPPELVRRNLVVSGINLLSLKNAIFQVGETRLEGTGLCAPCSRMEENLGPGGYNAMRGHGGITARVLSGGTVRVGDAVRFESLSPGRNAKSVDK